MSNGKLGLDTAPKVYLMAALAGAILSLAVSFVNGDAYIFLGYAIPQLCYLAAIFIYLRKKDIPPGVAIPFKKPVKPAALLVAPLVAVGLFGQNLILAVSFQWLVKAIGIDYSIVLPDFSSPLSYILGLLIMCILPAVGEELLFRGVALRSISEKGAVTAVFLSAALFSLSHGNLFQLVHQFLLGAALAYLTLQTGNIIYAMEIHFVNNLLAITLPLIMPAYNSLAVPGPQNAFIMLGICVAGVALLYPSMKLLIKASGGKEYSICKFLHSDKPSPEAKYTEGEPPACAPSCASDAVKKAWLIGLFVFLGAQILLNTLINAIPSLRAAMP
ncbi:MAG: CPBP family intramembrane metalloprotease [Clostridiales bacterium]|nr:CPBP family intramembrane metalloprotease [Clostridiales bacterium]